jgi:hypothetical protein
MARMAAVTSFFLSFRRRPLTADYEVSLGATLGYLRVAVSKIRVSLQVPRQEGEVRCK